VGVDQTSPDGSDFGSSSTEFHVFPGSVWVSLIDTTTGAVGGTNFDEATILPKDAGNGITYGKTQTGDQLASAEYSLELPSTLIPGDKYKVEIYQPSSYTSMNPSSEDAKYAFRMGPPYKQGGQPPNYDGSWADDLVWMQDYTAWPTLSVTPNTSNNSPEVPLAGLLPLVGLGVVGAAWWMMRKRKV
jgi:hypothetical protein